MLGLAAVVVIVLVGASTRIDIAPILGLLFGGGASAIVTAWVMLRRARTDREDTRADTASTLTKATATWSEYVDEKLDEVLAENRSLREQNLAQRAETAAAMAATAAAEAATARSEAERSRERHDMQSDLTARDAKIALLEKQVAEMRTELADLRAQQGALERRSPHERRDDRTS